MKKFITTAIAFLYLFTSTGATVHMHYCMGRLISSGLWHDEGKKDGCPVCGMAKKKGCCEDKHKVIKTDHQYDAKLSAFSISKITLQLPAYFITAFYLQSALFVVSCYPFTSSPPGSGNVPVYITNCVYLI